MRWRVGEDVVGIGWQVQSLVVQLDVEACLFAHDCVEECCEVVVVHDRRIVCIHRRNFQPVKDVVVYGGCPVLDLVDVIVGNSDE